MDITPATRVINVSTVLDDSRPGRLQDTTFLLCLLCMIVDGFDVQALGYTAPALVREWRISSAALGPVFAAGNFGVLIGALALSMLADRIGRRPVLIAGTLTFAVMTLLTARATSVDSLLALRFLAGIGMGTIIPNASALIGEDSPARHRATAIMIVGVGFTAGAALGGFVAAALIPAYGWQSVFYLGGAVPLLLALVMFVALPESLQLMVLRKKDHAAALRLVRRLDPSAPRNEDIQLVAREESKGGVPLLHLFRDGRGATTLLIWIVNFMNLLNLYSLASWLPTVVSESGYPQRTGVLIGATLQLGGTIGTLGLAWLVARQGFVRILTVTFAIACVSIAAIGQPGFSLPLLYALVFVAGWCIVGSQPGLNALSGNYYPTYVRSTGVGAGLGVGRIGAIVGPIIGGQLIAAQWTTRDMFLAAAIPAFVSSIAIACLYWTVGPRLGVSRKEGGGDVVGRALSASARSAAAGPR